MRYGYEQKREQKIDGKMPQQIKALNQFIVDTVENEVRALKG